jgi:hypothetical protein
MRAFRKNKKELSNKKSLAQKKIKGRRWKRFAPRSATSR